MPKKTIEQILADIDKKYDKKVYDLDYTLDRKYKKMLDTSKGKLEAKREKEKQKKLGKYSKDREFEKKKAIVKHSLPEGSKRRTKWDNKKAPSKIETKSSYKQKLLKRMQYYVRLRDTNKEGIGNCICCSKETEFEKMDGGHGISRRFSATCFDLRNINGQNSFCNAKFGLSGNPIGYKVGMDGKYGAGTRDKLEDQSKETVSKSIKWMEEEYQRIGNLIQIELGLKINRERFERKY